MIRGLLACLLISLTSHAHAQESKGGSLYQEAKNWLDKGDTEKAIKTFLASRTEYLKEKNYYRYFVATQALSIVYQDTGKGEASEKLILETMKVIPETSPDEWAIHAKLYDNLGYGYLYVMNEQEKALDAYSGSVSAYEKAGMENTKDIAFELVNRAVTLNSLSRYQLSINDMLRAIAIYEKDSETSAVALADHYHTLGVNYTQLEDFSNALSSLQRGLSLIATTDEKEIKIRLLNAIGNIYSAQGFYQKAFDNYEQARKLTEVVFGKEGVQYAESLINTGNAIKDLGDWETALTNYQQVLSIYQKTPPDNLGLVVDLFLNIARITDNLSLFEQSQAITQQSLTFATSFVGANSVEEASVYHSMAVTAYNHTEYDQSLKYNFKAISILEANHYPVNSYYAEIYEHIGLSYDGLKDFDLALKYKEQAIGLYTKVYGADHSSVGMAIGALARTYELAGQYDKALEYLSRSLATLLKTQAPDHVDIGITYQDIGSLHFAKKETQKAVTYFEKARVIFERQPQSKNLNKTKVYNRLASCYFALNDLPKTEQYYQKAIIANTYNFDNQDFDSFPEEPVFMSYYEQLYAYTSKADVYARRGDKNSLLKGLKQLEAADKLLKEKALDFSNVKDRLELAQLTTLFTSSGLVLANKLYTLTKDPIYVDKAFYYSERSKANELFGDIQKSRAASLSGIPKKVMMRRTELTNRLNTLQQQIASAYTSENQSLMTKLKAQELEIEKEFESLQTQIASSSPALRSVTQQQTLPSWNEVKKKLDAKTALISYCLNDSANYILVGNNSGLVIKKIPAGADIDKLVRGYTNQIRFQGPALESLSHQLTKNLWNPVEEALLELKSTGVEKIIIIPDGPLHYLPFESLGEDKFLLEKYTLQYQLSGALFASATGPVQKEKPSFISMAPVFEDKETNTVTASSQRFIEFARKTDTTSRAFTLNGEYVSPLPATRIEVEKIRQIHADRGHVTRSFIEETAKEELIKKGELENFDYVHLATHGFVNSEYPELSGLLLTQDSKSQEDGILYTGEILGLNFKADLVTLSACETALGKKIQGEGVRGLTTAFLFAGAKSVIASLWKVADESTSLLMIDFYNELLSGKSKAAALRSAKLNLLKNERYRHPYYWAPFVQIGGR
jgi:CHAT domain-containing protein